MTAAFLIYILKWALVISLLYSLYGLVLRRETFHGFNRVVLLSILVMSVILPLCRIQTEHATPVAEHMVEVETFIQDLSEYYVSTEIHPSATAGEVTVIDTAVDKWNSINVWLRFIILAYVAGLALAWFDYFRSFVSLFILIARGKRVRIDGLPRWVRVVESKVAVTPCSWMCWIILSPGEVSRAAVQHELTHLKFRHSFDLLLAEFTARMLWFLPIGWMLLQDLKDVHEYQVDHNVLSGGIDRDEYQELLINQVTAPNNMANRSFAVANSLILSSIKKRFAMMYKKPSSRKAALKALYILPCTLLALTVFARPTVINEIHQTLEQEAAVAPLLSPAPIVNKVMAEQPVEKIVEEKPEPVEEPKKEMEEVAKPQGDLDDSIRIILNRNGVIDTLQYSREDWNNLGESEMALNLSELQEIKIDTIIINISDLGKQMNGLMQGLMGGLVDGMEGMMGTANNMVTKINDNKFIAPQPSEQAVEERTPVRHVGIDLVITRERAADYTPENEHTYAVYENPRLNTEVNIPDMAWHYEYARGWNGTDDLITATFHVPDHEWWFFRFSSEMAVIDADTQERYPVKLMEYSMGECFWIRGAQNKNVKFWCVFPPLPKKVKRIQFNMHNSVHGQCPANTDFDVIHKPSKVYELKDLLRENGGITITQY